MLQSSITSQQKPERACFSKLQITFYEQQHFLHKTTTFFWPRHKQDLRLLQLPSLLWRPRSPETWRRDNYSQTCPFASPSTPTSSVLGTPKMAGLSLLPPAVLCVQCNQDQTQSLWHGWRPPTGTDQCGHQGFIIRWATVLSRHSSCDFHTGNIWEDSWNKHPGCVHSSAAE